MNIETKLDMAEAHFPEAIIGIREGHFVRFYQHSLCLWNALAQESDAVPTLKVSTKKIKKLGGLLVASGGVPAVALEGYGLVISETDTHFFIDVRDMAGQASGLPPSFDSWQAMIQLRDTNETQKKAIDVDELEKAKRCFSAVANRRSTKEWYDVLASWDVFNRSPTDTALLLTELRGWLISLSND